MENSTIYIPEKKKDVLSLTEGQKNAVRNITLGIEEVDEAVREMAAEDVIITLENGHPLNRVITGTEGGTMGYIACEDFVPREAYIKYLGTTKQAGVNLLKEIPAFLEYAKDLGYDKLNFHGWNERLNNILKRYGFERIRTDKMEDFAVDFYEKMLIEQKSSEDIEKERISAFEQKYLNKLGQDYQQTLATFSQDTRQGKERTTTDTFQTLSSRLAGTEGFEFSDRQKAVLKLKLARHFQNNDSCDLNTLYDAIIESPKFINTDKGSIHRLFEVHEEKTLQKIAEIRKQRAEMGDSDAFNPYENLFTTKSGNCYMVRLLNMPHLEEESEYMKHCVGTSDSYVNKIKRGDVEILSLRHIPKVNSQNQKLEGGIPFITIEYNLKTKTIEQMKKYDDGYLNKRDPYFDDVIDALRQLRTTKTDTGEFRDFSKISPSEMGNIEVKDEHILTEKGEVHFRDFSPNDGAFILKMGAMEITPETSKDDAVKMLKIVDGVDCTPDQIATSQNEVTKNTKAYIGPLFPNIFKKNIEHIYTSFPEGKFKTFETTIGGKTKEELEVELKQKNIKVGSDAQSLLESPDFTTSKNTEDVDLVRLTVGDLGFSSGATIDEIYKRAEELGLELCPPEVGPQLRLSYSGTEYLRIAMKQITVHTLNLHPDGSPSVFNLDHDGADLWLDTDGAVPSHRWHTDNNFVFRTRPPSHKATEGQSKDA